MRKLPNVFNREQIQKLIDVIDEPWVMVAVVLGLFCGLRRGEVSTLRVQNLDLAGRRVRIEDSKNPNRTAEGYGKDRIVPIPESLISILRRYLDLLGSGADYLFPSLKNPAEPITGEHLFRAYKQALTRANLNAIVKIDSKGLPRHLHNFHTLRHTYATLLWEKTGDILSVKHALGHTKIETTMIYTHVTNKVVEQKINEAFATRTDVKKALSTPGTDPLGILMRRLAMGEIDMPTFKNLRSALRSDNANYIG